MFAYTESDQGIRVDFITNAVKGDIEVMNPDADLDEFVSIEVDENEETLRTVRRYADHAAFRKAKNPIPEWFKRELENLVPIPTEG